MALLHGFLLVTVKVLNSYGHILLISSVLYKNLFHTVLRYRLCKDQWSLMACNAKKRGFYCTTSMQ